MINLKYPATINVATMPWWSGW